MIRKSDGPPRLCRGAGVPDFNKNAPPHRPGALDAPELSLNPGNGLEAAVLNFSGSFSLTLVVLEGPELADLGACRPFGTWGY